MRTVNRLKLIRLFITTVIVGTFIGAAAPMNAHAISFFSDFQTATTPVPQVETTQQVEPTPMAVQVEAVPAATPFETTTAIPIDSATATEPLETTETTVDITDSAYVSDYSKRDSTSFHDEILPQDAAERVTAIPKEPVPFTPEGTGTVVDSATDKDGKEFFTIETPDGNTFYLIVDRQREENNVYFLNAVTENDLASLAKPGDGMSVSAVESTGITATPVPTTGVPEPTPSPDSKPQDKGGGGAGSGNGIVIIAVIALLAAGGAGYYLKVIRPKKNATDNEDDFPDEDDDGGDDDDSDDDSNDGMDGDGDVDFDDEEIVLSDDDKDAR